MNLKEYLFRNDMKISDLAKVINYERTYLNAVVTGTRKPGRKMAEAIEKATDGQVTVDELLNPKNTSN